MKVSTTALIVPFKEMKGRKESSKSKARLGFEELKLVGVTVLLSLCGGYG